MTGPLLRLLGYAFVILAPAGITVWGVLQGGGKVVAEGGGGVGVVLWVGSWWLSCLGDGGERGREIGARIAEAPGIISQATRNHSLTIGLLIPLERASQNANLADRGAAARRAWVIRYRKRGTCTATPLRSGPADMTLDSDGGWRLRALVDDRKLSNYLLSTTHDAGKFKARFLMRHGFRPEAPHVLREALLEHAASAGVSTTVETAFGLKYVVAGRLASPDGRDPLVLSIWFESTGDPTVRLVTVYPRGGRK